MEQNLFRVSKANAQLIASCRYNNTTHTATLDNYTKYYPKPVKKDGEV